MYTNHALPLSILFLGAVPSAERKRRCGDTRNMILFGKNTRTIDDYIVPIDLCRGQIDRKRVSFALPESIDDPSV